MAKVHVLLKKEELDAYLHMLEEADKRDHRKLGKQLDFFHMQDEAPGMVFWHPRGWTIWQQVEQYMRAKFVEYGYQEGRTPTVMDRTLWEKSGHWENYRPNMFIAESEDRLLREIETLLAVIAAPFILMTPTPAHCTLRVEGVLRRNCCALIPLSAVLAPGERGTLAVTAPIDGILEEFDRALIMRGEGLVKTVEGIGRNLEAVATRMEMPRSKSPPTISGTLARRCMRLRNAAAVVGSALTTRPRETRLLRIRPPTRRV